MGRSGADGFPPDPVNLGGVFWVPEFIFSGACSVSRWGRTREFG